eukprot:m.538429 g.538429  ORF g.538429 m.538429 type:complete len:468 (-) comp22084_c0_seq5:1051-2454(-)
MEIEGISSGVTMKNDGDIYISIDDIQSDSTHVAVEEDGPDSMQSTSLEPDHTTDPEALEPDHTTDLEAACKSRKNSDSNEHETTEQFRDSSSVFCDQPTACRSQHNLHLLPDAGPDQSNAGGEAIAVINLSMDASKSQAFSKWFRGLRRDLKLAPGFLRYDRVELPQPKESPSDAKTHVSILVFFNSEDNLRSWLLSEERAYWLNRAKDDMLFEARDIDMHKGYARVAREGCRQRAIRPLPPPKWKLWVIVWFCMYTANLALDVADFMPRVERSGAVEFPVSLLLAVIITVTFITYAYSPVVVETQVFGYNLGMWLKLPHYQPSVPFKSGCLGFLCIAFAGAVNTLNTGFSIFNVAMALSKCGRRPVLSCCMGFVPVGARLGRQNATGCALQQGTETLGVGYAWVIMGVRSFELEATVRSPFLRVVLGLCKTGRLLLSCRRRSTNCRGGWRVSSSTRASFVGNPSIR